MSCDDRQKALFENWKKQDEFINLLGADDHHNVQLKPNRDMQYESGYPCPGNFPNVTAAEIDTFCAANPGSLLCKPFIPPSNESTAPDSSNSEITEQGGRLIITIAVEMNFKGDFAEAMRDAKLTAKAAFGKHINSSSLPGFGLDSGSTRQQAESDMRYVATFSMPIPTSAPAPAPSGGAPPESGEPTEEEIDEAIQYDEGTGVSEDSNDPTDEEINEAIQYATSETGRKTKTIKTVEERRAEFSSFTPITVMVDGKEVVITSPTGPNVAPGQGYTGEFGNAGSVGVALDNIFDEGFDHLKQGIINLIENNLISADVIIEALQQVPGAKFMGSFLEALSGLDCGPKPPVFSPPLGDIFKTTKLDICSGNGISAEITLPLMDPMAIGPFGDLVAIILQAAEDAIEMIIFNLLKMALSLAINIILDGSCEMIGDVAKLAGSSNLKEALRTAICGPNVTDEDLAKGINDILGALNSFDGPQPTNECVAEFMDKVGNVLTNEEVKGLLKGEPGTSTVEYVKEILKTGDPCMRQALSGEQGITKLFGGLGGVLQPDILSLFLDAPNTLPFNPNICQNPNGIENFETMRREMLKTKGLTPDQVDHQMAQDKALRKGTLDDLNNMLNSLADLPIPPLISDDPACPEKGILPNTDPATSAAVSDAFEGMYGTINISFMTELVNRQGLLNMILSDVRGAGLKWHTEFFIRFFGQPRSADLGLLGLFANEDSGRDTDFMGISPKVLGIFPDTVGIYLKEELTALSPHFQSTVATLPTGEKVFDLRLNYTDWDKIDLSGTPFSMGTIQYSVDIDYDHFILDKEGVPVWGNDYKIKISNVFDDDALRYEGSRAISPSAQEFMDNLFMASPDILGVKETEAVDLPDISTGANRGVVGGSVKLLGETELTGDVTAFGDPYYGTLYKSPQATVFGKMVQNIYLENIPTIGDISGVSNYCGQTLFNYVHNAIIKKFAVKITQNARAFDFGFDPLLIPQIKLLPPGEQYGGTSQMPPFYIEEPKYGGWLGIYDALVPEVDSCDRQPIIDFNSISKKVNDLNDKFKDDPRLKANPLCVIEPPYSRILEKEAAAAIEGSIIALVRLYIAENFIKGIPSFSLFKFGYPQTFDEILFGYIAESMLKDIWELGGNAFLIPSIKKHTFYYTFLEQVVQNFGRKVELKEIIITQEEQEALDQINYIVQTWEEPTGNFRKVKKRKEFEKYMAATKDYAKIILRRYVREELEVVANDFNSALKPSIHDLSSLVLGSPQWMVGSLTENGPLDVPDPVFSADGSGVCVGIENTIYSNPADTVDAGAWTNSDDLEVEMEKPSFLTGGGYFPFVLEKYIKIERYTSSERPEGVIPPELKGSPLNVTDSLTTILSLDEWKDFLISEKDTLSSYKIKDIWKSWSFGLRISCALAEDFSRSISETDWANLRDSISTDVAYNTKSFKLGVYEEGDPITFIFPLVSTELSIDGEQPPSPGLMDAYDVTCLTDEMIKSPEYKTLFEYCFPLPSLLSLVTIYTIEGFLPSLGQEWGTSNENGGKAGGKNLSQFKRWDKDTFTKTKKLLRKLFRINYHIRDIDYKDPESQSASDAAREKLQIKMKMPKIKIEGKPVSMPWWMRKLLRPKPIDACDVEDK